MFSAPQRLTSQDNLDDFMCGVTKIDTWFSKYAMRASKRGTAVVYITRDEQGDVAGFYTLSAHSMDRNAVTGWLARNAPDQIPVILLGMLAVSTNHAHEGLGTQLLLDAYHRARNAAETIGAKALAVDPIDASVEGFYTRHGFEYVPGSNRIYARF